MKIEEPVVSAHDLVISAQKIILAIDPSLTGLAVCHGVENQLKTSSTSSAPSNTLRGRMLRFSRLVEWVLDRVKEATPDLILIEGYSFGSKGAAVTTLAEFGGILRYRLRQSTSAPIVEVPPSVLKMFVTGKGNANKVLVGTSLAKRYGMTFKDDNHADAYGLARLGLVALGMQEAETKPQRIASDAIRSLIKLETPDEDTA